MGNGIYFRDELGDWRLTPNRVWRGVSRRFTWVVYSARAAWRNRTCSDLVVDSSSGVVVSITSFGGRIDGVFRTIESVGWGSAKPRRFILYIDARRIQALPMSLSRLVDRGLEIYPDDPEIGPHNKYYNYVESVPRHELPLVTIDDDIFVSEHWLRDLTSAYEESKSEVIVANWARTMLVEEGVLASSARWRPCETDLPSVMTALSGVWGVIYPPRLLNALRGTRREFMTVAPLADDVWLNVMALRTDIRVRQRLPFRSAYIPRYIAQRGGVSDHNLRGGKGFSHAGNDQQIRMCYSEEDVARLLRGDG